MPLWGAGDFKVTPPLSLNDPFEVKPVVSMGKYSEEDRSVARKAARESGMFMVEPSDDDVERLFLAAFPAGRFDEQEFPLLWPARLPELREEPFQTLAELDEFRANLLCERVERSLSDAYGIFSMSEDPANLLMWAHYASAHYGTAVGFDKNSTFFRTSGAVLSRVEYAERRVSVSSVDGMIRVAGHRFEEGKPLPLATLLRKHSSWAYEREWRLISPLSAATTRSIADGAPVHLVRPPTEAVRALVIGARISDEDAKAYARGLSIGRWEHVQVFKARLSKNNFGLDFESVTAA